MNVVLEEPASAKGRVQDRAMGATPIDRVAYRERAMVAGRDFVSAVKEILPGIRARREQSERDGKVPDATIDAMIDAGVFRTFTPIQYGGMEIDPASFFEGIIHIAQADSSAAWVAGQVNCHALEVARMDPRMQDDFWGQNPDARASSSFAPLGKASPVDGGYLLSGTWTFSSGVDHAQWVVLGGGDRNYLVPTSQMSIDHGSWDVQGLRGTGSKAVTLDKVFVPEYRVHKLLDTFNDTDPGLALNDRPLYRTSYLGVYNSTATNTVIGTALEGIHDFIEQSRNRLTKQGTGTAIANNPFLHLKLADALTKVNGVRKRHLDNWRDLFDKACRGEECSTLDRMRVRFESADANATCFDAIHDLWPIAGAAATNSSNHLQQVYRHLMAGRNHGSAGRELAAGLYIKTLFGMPAPEFVKIDPATLAYFR
jgi:3-hydroxy-9,10-secoandrosta-1,3,5(10)-triene-9,17-dione monooxygenase